MSRRLVAVNSKQGGSTLYQVTYVAYIEIIEDHVHTRIVYPEYSDFAMYHDFCATL